MVDDAKSGIAAAGFMFLAMVILPYLITIFTFEELANHVSHPYWLVLAFFFFFALWNSCAALAFVSGHVFIGFFFAINNFYITKMFWEIFVTQDPDTFVWFMEMTNNGWDLVIR